MHQAEGVQVLCQQQHVLQDGQAVQLPLLLCLLLSPLPPAAALTRQQAGPAAAGACCLVFLSESSPSWLG